MNKRILIALGGNAIKQSGEKGTTEEQYKNCWKTTKYIAEIVKDLDEDDRLIITHGNGPQVGNLMVQQESAKNTVSPHPMYILGAMTQGQIGYMLQQTLREHLNEIGINTSVCALVNQVLVDQNDPEFFGDKASKPVGNFLTEEEAKQIKEDHPEYIIKKVKPKGEYCWRRTVPSPEAVKLIKKEINKINFFPKGSIIILRKKLAHKLSTKEEMIIISSGVDNVISLIEVTFINKNDEIIISEN